MDGYIYDTQHHLLCICGDLIMWLCKKCKQLNQDTNQFCGGCGGKRVSLDTTSSEVQTVVSPAIRKETSIVKCPRCGLRITNANQFPMESVICSKCTSPLFPEHFRGIISCPECGRKNTYSPATIDNPNAAICGICGKPLFPILYMQQPVAKSMTNAMKVGMISLLVMIAGGGSFIWASSRMEAYRTGIGQFALTLDAAVGNSDVASAYHTASVAYYGGIVAMIIGGVSLLASIIVIGIIINIMKK